MLKKSVFLCLLALLLAFCAVYAEEEQAPNLSVYARFHFNGKSRLNDGSLKSGYPFEPNKTYRASWEKKADVRYVLFRFWDEPGPYTVVFCAADETPLSSCEGVRAINALYTLPEGTRLVKFVNGEQHVTMVEWEFYGAGQPPEVLTWEPLPEKLEYMVIATHFDDDVLFLGAAVPILTGKQGRTGTLVYTASKNRARLEEALHGARAMGLFITPLFTRFTDAAQPSKAADFSVDSVTEYLVRAFRQYKPEVVVTQDINGEYGHWQHKATVSAVRKAVLMAADPGYDPLSAEQYGTWQVKKLYLHLYSENTLTLDVNEPIPALGGLSAYEAAVNAFQCHVSQVKHGRHSVKNEGVYDLSAYGLAYTAVGPDTPGVNDMFEHIA